VIRPFALREVEADVRKDLDGGIEERGALDATWIECGELVHQPTAERMTDELGATHAQ
jgi:hypothetical protein